MAQQRGRGRRGRNDDPDVQLSKTLSYILRHGAEKLGLDLRPGGFVYVEDILQQPQCSRFTVEDVRRVVENNEKKRFHLEENSENGRLQIRANQGHSVQVEGLALTPVTSAADFPVVVHGTYLRCWEAIRAQGLHRMNRTHIHLAPGEPGQDGVISGMRGSCDVLVFINLEAVLADNIPVYLSANGVILCAGDQDGYLKPKYFSRAVHRRNGQELPLG